MVLRTFAIALVSAAMLSACAPADETADPASEEEEVRVGTGYRYHCTSTNTLYLPSPLMVTLTSSASKMTVAMQYSDGRQAILRGSYDANYHPTGNVTYSRYGSFDLIWNAEVLASTVMRTGATSGSIKIQGNFDGFASVYYHCRRTTDVAPSEHRATAPNSFAKQISGEWDFASPDIARTGIRNFSVMRDGRYMLYTNHDQYPETGVWTATGAQQFPMAMTLHSGSYTWHATIDGVGRTMHFTRGAVADDMIFGWYGNSQSVCVATHGTWTGNASDPATWLECQCPAGATFVPGNGGCVE